MCYLFNDQPTTENYTLSLHDALPILRRSIEYGFILYRYSPNLILVKYLGTNFQFAPLTSELTCYEIGRDTSELQSHVKLVCRLLLEKKKTMDRREPI